METPQRRSTDSRLIRITATAVACWAVIATIGMAALAIQQHKSSQALRTAVQAKQLAQAIQGQRHALCEDQNARHNSSDAFLVRVIDQAIKAQPAQKAQLEVTLVEYEQLVQDLAPLSNCTRIKG